MPSRRRPDPGSDELISREPEIAALDQLLTAGCESLAVLLLEGEPGIGKTSLFREALRRAEARGFHVLSSRPGASEVAMPLAAVAELLGAVPAERLKALPLPQRRALASALLEVDPDDRPIAERAVAAGMRSLVASLAAERPVLFAVDDVQWLDAASVGALDFVIRRLKTERVALLATRRLLEPVKLDLEALVPRDTFARVRLAPLSLGALQRLLKERLGITFQRSTLVRIHTTSGGNPLFALEIGRALADRPAISRDEPLPVPDDIREFVRARVIALPDATRDLLLAGALLAYPSVDVLRRARNRSVDVDLEPAERAGIAVLEGGIVRFSHPLHAAAVIAATTTAERRRMHLRLAEAVGALKQRAQHLAPGSSEPDEATARLLEEGASAAHSRGGPHVTAELLERARELTPPSDPAAGRTRGIRAAEFHGHAGDRARARRLLDELLLEPLSGAQRAEALRLCAALALAEEDLPTAERQLLEALAIADDPASRARLRVALCYILVLLSVDLRSRASEFGQQALTELTGCNDGHLLAEALAYTAIADLLAGRGVDWSKVERAIELDDPNRISLPGLPPSGLAALIMIIVGRHAEARQLMNNVCTRLAERGHEGDLALALLWLSWLETRSGDFRLAAELADQSIACASLAAGSQLRRWALAQRALVDAHLGAIEAAREECEEAASSAEGSVTQIDIGLVAVLAMAEISLGDHAAAWRASRALTEALEQRGLAEPVAFAFLPDALEALIGLGELDRAEALIDLLEGRARQLDRGWALVTGGRCRGLLLAARGDLAEAASALDRTLEQHNKFDFPFERARTLLVQGTVERRRRRRNRAAQVLAEALAEFARMGAQCWVDRARAELDRVGSGNRGTADGLSRSERRVGELAAQGLSNKEIAATLFVSVHTVEVHLSRVYAKLGVHSRTRLAERLRARE